MNNEEIKQLMLVFAHLDIGELKITKGDFSIELKARPQDDCCCDCDCDDDCCGHDDCCCGHDGESGGDDDDEPRGGCCGGHGHCRHGDESEA